MRTLQNQILIEDFISIGTKIDIDFTRSATSEKSFTRGNRNVLGGRYDTITNKRDSLKEMVQEMKRLFAVAVVAALAVSMLPMHGQDEVLLKVACLVEPETLNIWKAPDVWSTHIYAWFYPSFYYRKPVTNEPFPDFCTIAFDELKANSPDGLTYTFPLRNTVSWDDGTPMTAYDFEFTYNLIVEMQFPDYLPMYKDVEYMKALDNYTIELKLGKCTPQFEESLIYHFAVPQHQFGPMAKEARKTSVPMQTLMDMPVENPISCGPFSFVQWERGAFVKLITYDGYYGKGRTINVEGVGTITEGPDYDGLLLKLYSTIDAALQGIEKGEIDFVYWNLDPSLVAQLRGKENISIATSDELRFYYLAPHISLEPFDDVVLRQALVYLVDKEYIVSELLQDYGEVAHSVVTPAAGDWYNDNVHKYGDGMSRDERVAKAKEILTAAGYTVPDVGYADGGVIKLPDGSRMKPFEILTPPESYDPVMAGAGVLIEEWWREIGVPVTVGHRSLSEMTKMTFETQNFDWFILGQLIGGSGYPVHLRYFHSNQAVSEGNNPMGYKNPTVDKYLEDLMTLCDRKELITAAWRAQEIIVEDVGCCPLYYKTVNEAYRTDNFEGWLTQLGGIAGTESPRHYLLYLKPVTEVEESPEEFEDIAKEYEKKAREYEEAEKWREAAENWEEAATNREKAAEAWGNPINLQNASKNFGFAGKNWRYAGLAWEKTIEGLRHAILVWEKVGGLNRAIIDMENSIIDYRKAGNTDGIAISQAEKERLEDRKLTAILAWLVLTIVFIAIALSVIKYS